mmetsp:Transcript_15162/g.34689  ORF Transcript_15162/g.34689 Transcript_15162/m.34689 type:complete len:103 (-) Transcript_15162:71-379(-)
MAGMAGRGAGTGVVQLLVNLGAIVLTLPNHASFYLYLTSHSPKDVMHGASMFVFLVFTPLNLLVLLVTTLDSVRVQAVVGIVFACIQFYTGRRIQRRGMMVL